MKDYNKPSPAAARLYRMFNVLALLTLAALGGCAAANFEVMIKMTCARVENHHIEVSPDSECVICREPGAAVMACNAK